MASALDMALEGKSEALKVRILRLVADRGMDKDDPVLDLFVAAETVKDAAHTIEKALKDGVAQVRESLAEGQHSPRIVEELAVLRGAIEASRAESGRLLGEFERQGDHLLKILKLTSDRIFLTERRERRERIDAIAREILDRVERPSKSHFGLVLALCAACFFTGGWLEHESLKLRHEIAPRPIAYRANGRPDCVHVQDGREACFTIAAS
jgi:hypothetical protein